MDNLCTVLKDHLPQFTLSRNLYILNLREVDTSQLRTTDTDEPLNIP